MVPIFGGNGSPLPAAVVSAGLFGMNWESGSNPTCPPSGTWPSQPFAYGRIWFTTCRWAALETSQGVRDFTALQTVIAYMKAQQPGIKLIWNPAGTPNWASGTSNQADQPTTLSWFADFMAAAVQAVGSDLYAIEGWNEANLTQWWTGSLSTMAAMQAPAYAAAKTAKPTLIYLTPSFVSTTGPGAFASYLAAGGGAAADAPCIHLYPPSATPTVDQLAIQIAQYQAALASAGSLRDAGLYVTECGWGNNSSISNANLQAAFLGQFFITAAFLQCKLLTWYSWNGQASNGSWGALYDIVGNALTTAGVAYGYVYAWLNGATITSLQITGTIYRATLTRAGGYLGTAVWNTAGGGSYTPLAGVTQYRDLAGNTTAWSSGAVTLDANGKPLLFEPGTP